MIRLVMTRLNLFADNYPIHTEKLLYQSPLLTGNENQCLFPFISGDLDQSWGNNCIAFHSKQCDTTEFFPIDGTRTVSHLRPQVLTDIPSSVMVPHTRAIGSLFSCLPKKIFNIFC